MFITLRTSASRWLTLSTCWMLIGFITVVAKAQPFAIGPDPVDKARASRYLDALKKLQENRVLLRDRTSSLVAQSPNLQRELYQAMRAQLMTSSALEVIPPITAVPELLQTWRAYRGNSGNIYLKPELLVWYAFQDNTLIRQQLFFNLADANLTASQTYATLESNRIALLQIADSADENFLDFRRHSDLLGRRSPLEIAEAGALASAWHKDDPLHAGAALLRAYALRSTGQFNECTQLLDELDNNYPAMESIATTVAAQIAFLTGKADEARRTLDKAVAMARGAGTEEALLVYGYISLAEKKWSDAKNFAARARQFPSENPEAAILEALATIQEHPDSRSRDPLQWLRRVQLQVRPDDWHYHEALAVAHIAAGDRNLAKKEIATALGVAPSHIRSELLRVQTQIEASKVPKFDWQARLLMQWLP